MCIRLNTTCRWVGWWPNAQSYQGTHIHTKTLHSLRGCTSPLLSSNIYKQYQINMALILHPQYCRIIVHSGQRHRSKKQKEKYSTKEKTDNLSWLIHSKALMLDTSCSTSLATTSLAWTSITIRAERTARCILDRCPLTSCTKSPSFRHKKRENVKNVSIQ